MEIPLKTAEEHDAQVYFNKLSIIDLANAGPAEPILTPL